MFDLENLIEEVAKEMEKTYKHAQKSVKKIRANRVEEDMLQDIKIDYYGVLSPINQLSSIKVDSMTTLRVKPWEKKLLPSIERAIIENNDFGFTTRSDKDEIYVTLPIITEEIRHKLVKQTEQKAEQSRVAIRNIRKKAKDQLKEIKSEDEMKRQENELQKLTDNYIERIDTLQKNKKEELMKV